MTRASIAPPFPPVMPGLIVDQVIPKSPTWSISLQGFPFLGGFDDKTAQPKDPAAKRLIVKGSAVMGGVEVTN
jgi:hypothetical protein